VDLVAWRKVVLSKSHCGPYDGLTASLPVEEPMNQWKRRVLVAALLSLCGPRFVAVAQEPAPQANCKDVHATMLELASTTGCKPGHPSCFLGEVDGNQGLRGTTYFRADSAATGPSTSPGFISYSGVFEYTTDRGVLTMRETGVVNQTTGNIESGAVTAFQKITGATGELAGATGYFFVSGFSRGGRVVTQLGGQICFP
jgi:hypothetical protein